MDAAPAHPFGTQGRLRNLNLTMLLPAIVVGGVIVVATDAQTWWEAIGLGVGVAAALVAFVAWTSGDLPRVAVPCLVAAAAV